MGMGGEVFPRIFEYFESKEKIGCAMVGSCEYDLFPFLTKEEQKGKFLGKAHEGVFGLGYTTSSDALEIGIPSFSRTTISSENPTEKGGNWEVKLPDGTLRTYEKIGKGKNIRSESSIGID